MTNKTIKENRYLIDFSVELRNKQGNIYRNYIKGVHENYTTEPTFDIIESFNSTDKEHARLLFKMALEV